VVLINGLETLKSKLGARFLVNLEIFFAKFIFRRESVAQAAEQVVFKKFSQSDAFSVGVKLVVLALRLVQLRVFDWLVNLLHKFLDDFFLSELLNLDFFYWVYDELVQFTFFYRPEEVFLSFNVSIYF